MNILYIDHYAGSPLMGMEYRPYFLALEWQRMGHKVLIAAADYSHLRQKNPATSGPCTYERVEGVDYLFLQTGAYAGNTLRRIGNVFSFLSRLYGQAAVLAAEFEPDVVISGSTYPMDIYPAMHIARLAGAKLVHEIHDIQPESYCELYHRSSWHPYALAMRAARTTAYRKSDHIVSLLPLGARHVEEQGVHPGKVTYIPNGVSTELGVLIEPAQHAALIRRYRAKGYFIVLYLGGFAAANALEPFVRSAAHVDADVLYILVGDGKYKQQIKRIVREERLDNVLCLDSVPRQSVPGVLALADALFIGGSDLKVYRYGVGMNKLYDYMYAGKPLICTLNVPHNPAVKARCALMADGNSPMAIAQAVQQLQQLPAHERDLMGDRGRDYVLQHNRYASLARRFLQALDDNGELGQKTPE